jgi:hypothetical protein
MKTRRHKSFRRKNRKTSRKLDGGKKNKSGKKWVTAIDAAQKTLAKTGDINAARISLRKQALTNARKLFGSISSSM